MVKIKHPKVGSSFLRPEDVGDDHLVEIVGEGAYQDSEYRSDQLVIPVVPVKAWMDGTSEEKSWSLNRTSEAKLFSAFGGDTAAAVGRRVAVMKNRENVRGKMKDVMYLRPLSAEEQPKVQRKMQPSAGPEVAGSLPPSVTPETAVWLRYNETLIGSDNPIDPVNWNFMPSDVKRELKTLGWITYRDGYPYLMADARSVL